jgi:hypothetical protein
MSMVWDLVAVAAIASVLTLVVFAFAVWYAQRWHRLHPDGWLTDHQPAEWHELEPNEEAGNADT